MKRTSSTTGNAGPYIAIDLKSFYASVECVERGLDPLTTNLLVADESRSDGTICLAVSPSLKALGVPGRPRLFEAKQKIAQAQARLRRKIDYIIAPPQMAKYLEVSASIYAVYLKYIAPQDIHVYSIDEVFIDAAPYLRHMHMTAHELALTMIRDVLSTTGITATAGIGTNLYLAKIAMDIVAKKAKADKDGVRIAELDEQRYKELLWDHLPLTDFWMISHGTVNRLARLGVSTMGDLAQMSLCDEPLLYRIFGVDAEILVDHAWGVETVTMADIKNYRTSSTSLSSGQVLSRPYPFEQTRLVIAEMTEHLMLELLEKRLTAEAIVLHVGYDKENCEKGEYHGLTKLDYLGRKIPVSAHGTADLGGPTSLTSRGLEAVLTLFDKIVDRNLTARRLNIAAIRVAKESDIPVQFDLFCDYAREERERELSRAIITMHRKYGKNAVLRGHDLLEGATQIERNGQIGGHRAESTSKHNQSDKAGPALATDAEAKQGQNFRTVSGAQGLRRSGSR